MPTSPKLAKLGLVTICTPAAQGFYAVENGLVSCVTLRFFTRLDSVQDPVSTFRDPPNPVEEWSWLSTGI